MHSTREIPQGGNKENLTDHNKLGVWSKRGLQSDSFAVGITLKIRTALLSQPC